ncbi:MAG: hypothetical protein U0990_09745 [Candidatus Nanopelagicales bacterium]|nr:hypothetical protein [Candidatus Nanopelagicales bacterium]
MYQAEADSALSVEADFQAFFTRVRELWPGYRCTPSSLRGTWLRVRDLPTDAVLATLSELRDADPDAKGPVWREFRRRLGGPGRGGQDEWMCFLDLLRSSIGPSARDMGDREVFDCHVRAQTTSIVQRDGVRRPESRPRYWQLGLAVCRRWVLFFRGARRDPPNWLMAALAGWYEQTLGAMRSDGATPANFDPERWNEVRERAIANVARERDELCGNVTRAYAEREPAQSEIPF